MKTKYIIISISVQLILLPLIILSARPSIKITNIQVISASPNKVILEAGGATATVTIKGVNLNKVKLARVLKGKHICNDITATIVSTEPTSLTVNLKAELGAQPKQPYSLKLVGEKREQLNIPTDMFSIEVALGKIEKPYDLFHLKVLKSDLIIKDLKILPENITTANQVAAVLTIKNQGLNTAKFTIGTPYIEFIHPKNGTPVKWTFKEEKSLKPDEEFSIKQTIFQPDEINAGTYSLVFTVDPSNQITESNENNNSRSIDFKVTAEEQPEPKKLPDLRLREAYATPTVKEGSLNSFACTTINDGASYAGVWNVTFLVDDIIVSSKDSYDLREGQVGGSQFNWNARGVGKHQLTCIVDREKKIAESDETNNSSSVEFVVTEPEAPVVKKPDLIVKEFKFMPDNATTADALYTSFRLKNQGDGIATFRQGDNYIEFTDPINRTQRKHAISTGRAYQPGEEFSPNTFHYSPNQVAAGDYIITVKVDPDNVIDESNEDNNTLTFNWTLAQGGTPDLVISEIRVVAPESPIFNNIYRYNIYVVIRNQGNGPAYLRYKALECPDIYISDMVGTQKIDPNGTYQVTLSKDNPPAGTYNWRFTVDPANQVAESDETNNTYTTQFVVTVPDALAGKKPDLIVKEFKFMPDNATTADALYTSFRLKNQGDGVATFQQGDNYIEFTDPINRTQRKFTISTGRAYQPGEEFSPHTFHYSPNQVAAGDYIITVKVDPDNVIDESNEDNNTLTFNWSLAQGGTPDLVISEIRVVAPESPIFNNIYRYNIYVIIRNQGSGPAYLRYKALECPDIYIPDMVGTQKIDPNGTYQVTLSKDNPPAGTYNWRFTVDPANQVAESDETNNSREVQFEVK